MFNMELTEKEQQSLLIDQLKDLIRKKDEEVTEKNKLLKDSEAKLNKSRLLVKAKDAKLAALAKKGDSVQSETTAHNGNADRNSKSKLLIQQKRIEQKEDQIAKQHKALKDKEERFARMEAEFNNKHVELTQQLKEVSSNQGMDLETMKNDSRHMEELYGAIVTKDQRITELTAKLDERESQLKARDKTLKEMEETLTAKLTNETHQALLLDRLSAKVAEQEERVAMTTEETSGELQQLQKELKHQREQVAHLEQRLQEKEETVGVKEEQILQMKRENDARIIDVQEVALENEQLIRSLKRKLHEQDEVLSGKDKVVQLLQDELQDKVQEHDELQKTIHILQQNLRENFEGRQLLMEEMKNIQEKQNMVHGTDDAAKTLQLMTALQQYEQAYKQASEITNSLTTENISLKEKIQSLEEEHSKLYQNFEMTRIQLETMTNDQTETQLKETILSLQKDLEEKQRLKEEHARAMEVRMQTVLDQLNAQTKVLENQTIELNEYKASFNNLETRNLGVTRQEELQDALTRIGALETALKEATESCDQLQHNFNESMQENSKLKSTISEHENIQEQYVKKLEETKMKLHETVSKLDENIDMLKVKEDESEKMRVALEEMRLQQESLNKEAVQKNLEYQQTMLQLEEMSSQLTEQLKAKNEDLNIKDLNLSEVKLNMQNLQNKLLQTQQEHNVLNSQIENLTTESSSLKHTITGLQESYQHDMDSLSTSLNKSLSKEVEKFEAASLKITVLEKVAEEHEVERIKTREELTVLSSQLDENKLQHSQLEKDCNNNAVKAESYELKLKSTLNLLQDRSIEIDALTGDFTGKCEEVTNLNKEISTLMEQLEQEKSQVTTMTTEAEVAVTKIGNLLEQVKELEVGRTQLQDKIYSLEDEVAKANACLVEKNSLEKLFEEKDKTIALLEKEISVIKDKLDVAKKSLNEVVSEKEECNLAQKQRHSEVEELKRLLDKTNGHRERSETALKDATSEMEDSRRTILSLKENNSGLQKRLEVAITELDNMKIDVEDIQSSKEKMIKDYELDKERLSDILNDVKLQLSDSLEKNAQLTSNLASSKEHYDLLQREHIQVSQESVENKEKLVLFQADMEGLKLNFKQQNDELVSQLQESKSLVFEKMSELDSLNSELKILKSGDEEKAQKLTLLTNELSSLSDLHQRIETKLEDVSLQYKHSLEDDSSLQEQIEEKKCMLARFKEDLEVYHTTNDQQAIELKKLTDQNNSLLTRVSQLEREVDERKVQETEENVVTLQNALSEKNHVMEEVSSAYSKLQDELQACKKEFEIWREESEIVKERDDALQRASELKDSLEKHNAQLESRLSATEQKLQNVENERDNINTIRHHHHRSYDDYPEENLGDLQVSPRPLHGVRDDRHQQGMEYLQMQLEELAHEQEVQSQEHEKRTFRLNETIRRLSEEKQQLLEAFEKQSESLNDVLKRYEEKDTEWNKLTRLVETQQHNLVVAQASQASTNLNFEKNSKEVQNLEEKVCSLEEKYQEKMAELTLITEDKEKYEFEIPELKSKLSSLKEENILLIDQTKVNKATIETLQQELEHAVENAEVNNCRHQEEIERLKSLLRDKDQEITTLHEDVDEQKHEIKTLSQSISDKTYECEELNENLLQHQNKVSHLTSELRQRDAEIVAMSQQNDGAVEQAQVRAKDLAKYVATLEARVADRDDESKTLKLEIENLRDRIIDADQNISETSHKLKENDELYQNKLYEIDEKYHIMLNEYEEAKVKYDNEISSEKAKNQQLQERLNSQASDVSDLTLTLERQICESADHHQEASFVLEKKLEDLQLLLRDEREKVIGQDEKLEDSRSEIKQLKAKIVEQEKWETEAKEKNQLCEQLSSSCSLLEERLNESLKQGRICEEELRNLHHELADSSERLEQREELVKQLGVELTRSNDEVRSLKEDLQSESERQMNELNSVIKSRMAERDEQLQTVTNQIKELHDIIKQKDEIIAVKEHHDSIMKEKLNDLEEVQNNLKQVQSIKNQLEVDLEEMKRKEESWITTSTQLEIKVKELLEKSDQSQVDSSIHEDEISHLTEQLNKSKDDASLALEDQAAKHEAQKEKAKKIVRAQQIQMKHIKEEKEKLVEELKQLREEVSTKDKLVEENFQKQDSGNEKINSLLEQIEELEQELIASTRKCEESEILCTSLKEQISTIMVTSQEDINVKDDIITKMKSELSLLIEKREADKETWNKKLKNVVNIKDETQQEYEKVMQKLQELETERRVLLNDKEGLHSKENELNVRISEISSSLDQYSKENVHLVEKTTLLEKQLSDLCEEKDLVSKSNEDMQQSNLNLSSTLREVQEQNRSLICDKEDMSSIIQTLEHKLKQSNLSLEEKQESLGLKTEQLAAILLQVEESEKGVSNLEERLKEASHKIEELESEKSGQELSVIALKQEISDTKSVLLEREKQLVILQKDKSFLEETVKTLNEEKVVLQTSLNSKMANSLEEHSMLQESLRVTIQELNQSLLIAQEDAEAANSLACSLKKSLKSKEEELVKYKEEQMVTNEALLQKDEENKEQLTKLSFEYDKVSSELKIKEENLQNVTVELSNMREKKDQCEEQFTTSLVHNESELLETKEALDRIRIQFNEAKKNKDDLETSFNENSVVNEKLQSEMNSLHSNTASLNLQLQESEREKENILNNFNEKLLELKAASEKIQQLQDESKTLKDELKVAANVGEETLKANKEKDDILNELTHLKEQTINSDEMLAKLRVLMEEEQQKKVDALKKVEVNEILIGEMKGHIDDLTAISLSKEEKELNKVHELQAKLTFKEEELSNLQDNLQSLQEDSLVLERKFKDAEIQLDYMQSSKEEFNIKLNLLEEELKKKKEDNEHLEMKIQELSNELSTSQASLETFKELAESRQAEVTRKQVELESIQNKVHESEKQVDDSNEFVEKIKYLEKTISEKEKSLTETQRKLKASLVSRKSLMSKLKDTEALNAEMENMNKSLVEEKSLLTSRLSDSLNISQQVEEERYQQSADSESSRMMELEDEVGSLKVNLKRKTQDLEQAGLQYSKLEEKNAMLLQEVSDLNTKCQEMIHLEDKLMNIQKEHESQVDSHLGEANSLQKNILLLQQEKSQLLADVDRLSDEVEVKAEEIKSLLIRLSSSEEELENQNFKYNSIQHEFESLKKEFKLRQEEFDNELKLQLEKNNIALSQYQSKQEEVDILKSQYHSKEEELDNLKSQYQSKQEELDHLKIEFSSKQDELEYVHQQLKEETQRTQADLSSHNSFEIIQSQLGESLSQLESLKGELQTLATKKKDIENERDCERAEYKRNIGNLQAQLEQQINSIQTLQSEDEDKVSDLNELQSKFDEISNEMILVQREKDDMISQYNESNNALKEVKQSLTEARKGITNFESEKQHQKMEMDALVESHLTQVRELETKIMKLTETLNLNQSADSVQHEEMQKTLEAEGKAAQLQRKLKAALVSRKELLAASKLKDEELKTRTDELHKVKANLESLQQEKEKIVEQLKEEKNSLELKSSSSNDIVETLNSQLKKVNERLSVVEDENIAYKKKIDKLKTEILTLETCNKDMNEMVSAMEGRTRKLEKSLAERTDSLKSSQKCIRKLEVTLAQGETSLQDVVQMKKQIKVQEEKVKSLTEKCNYLETEKCEKVSMLEKLISDFEKETMAKEDLVIRCNELEKKILQTGDNESVVYDHDTSNMRIEYDALLGEHTALKQAYDQLEENSHTEDGMSKIKEEYESLVVKNQELSDEKDHILQEMSDLRNKLNEVESDMKLPGVERKGLVEPDGSSISVYLETEPQVTVKEENFQTFAEQDLMRARLEVVNETLTQLKVTQPEMWNQEPGIKKLINKIEEVAGRAASNKKESEEWKKKWEEEEKKSIELQTQIKKWNDDVVRRKKSESNLTEETGNLREVKDDFDSLKKKYDALQRDCDHLNTALQEEKESYEQIQKRLDRENALLKHQVLEQRKKSTTLQSHLQEVEKVRTQNLMLEESNQNLQKKMESALNDAEGLRICITEKESNHEAAYSLLEKKIEEMKLQISETQNELIRLKEEKQQLKVNLDEAECSSEEVVRKLTLEASNLQEKMERSEVEAKSRIQDLESSYSEVQGELKLKKEELDEMYMKQDESTKELNDGKMLLEDLKTQLREKEAEIVVFQESMNQIEVEKRHLQERVVIEPLQGSAETETNETVENLQSEVESLQKELEERQALVSDLVSDCMRLKNELAAAKADVERYKKENSGLFSQTQSLLALETQYQTNENHLKSELADKDRVIHRQQEEVKVVRSQQHQLFKDYGVSSVTEIQVMLAAYVVDIKSLKDEIIEKQRDVERLENEVSVLEEDKSRLNDDNSKKLADIDALNHNISEQVTELSTLIQRSGIAEERCSILEEELEDSRKRWEEEKLRFIMKIDEEETTSKSAFYTVEEYKQHVVNIENQSCDYFNQLKLKTEEVHQLQNILTQHQAQMEEDQKKSNRLQEQLKSIEEDCLKQDSIFTKVIHLSHPNLAEESYQHSSDDMSNQSSVETLKDFMTKLEHALHVKNSTDDENRLRLLEERVQTSEARLQNQTNHLLQVVSNRDEIHAQLSATTNALQQYEAQFKNLHAEYLKLKEASHAQTNVQDVIPRDHVSQLDYRLLQDRLNEEVEEKQTLSDRLMKLEDQLREEIENKNEIVEKWREEVHSLWKSQQDPTVKTDSSSTFVNIGEREEEAVLLKPASFTRKVKRSKTRCFQWIKGRSHLRTHVRPYSLRALVAIYFIFLHVFTVKCAIGL